MSAPELKPCPFCGGKGHIHKDPDPDHGDYYCVKCSKCRAKSPEFHASETCPIFFGQVRDAWNTRADLCDPTQERVKGLVEAAIKEGMRIAAFAPIEQVPEAFNAALRDMGVEL